MTHFWLTAINVALAPFARLLAVLFLHDDVGLWTVLALLAALELLSAAVYVSTFWGE